jgi:hypothetical protein
LVHIRSLIILCLAVIGGIAIGLWLTAANCDRATILNAFLSQGTKTHYYAKVKSVALWYNDKLITLSKREDFGLILDKLAFGTAKPDDAAGGFPVQVSLVMSCGTTIPFRIIYNPKTRNVLTFEYSVGSRLSFADPFKYRTVRLSDDEVRSSQITELLDQIVGER